MILDKIFFSIAFYFYELLLSFVPSVESIGYKLLYLAKKLSTTVLIFFSTW